MPFKPRHIRVGGDPNPRMMILQGKKVGPMFSTTLHITEGTSSGSVSWEPTPDSLRELAGHLNDLADWVENLSENAPPPPLTLVED